MLNRKKIFSIRHPSALERKPGFGYSALESTIREEAATRTSISIS